MAKKTEKQDKPLTQKEVAHLKVEDQAAKMQQVMGFGLASAYGLSVEAGATVAGQTNPATKAANVDALPEQPKQKTDKK